MKIILRQDVEKLGEAGAVKTVSDGFARNYLIPKGLAILATPGELKVVEHNQKVQDRKIERQEQAQRSLADRIEGQKLTFNARAGQEGRLFGSVTVSDIAERLSKIVGQEIDRRKVVLDEPIRATGEHSVAVHLVGRLRPHVTVIVEGIDSPAEAASSSEDPAPTEPAVDSEAEVVA
ncbi:MAG: 50S ribosomal protein L9, partial [Thermomicrobiales bacterium]